MEDVFFQWICARKTKHEKNIQIHPLPVHGPWPGPVYRLFRRQVYG